MTSVYRCTWAAVVSAHPGVFCSRILRIKIDDTPDGHHAFVSFICPSLLYPLVVSLIFDSLRSCSSLAVHPFDTKATAKTTVPMKSNSCRLSPLKRHRKVAFVSAASVQPTVDRSYARRLKKIAQRPSLMLSAAVATSARANTCRASWRPLFQMLRILSVTSRHAPQPAIGLLALSCPSTSRPSRQ